MRQFFYKKIKKVFLELDRYGRGLVVFLIEGYQVLGKFFYQLLGISGCHCRFYPTCAEYTKEAFLNFNFVKALILGLRRLLQCQPFGRSGFDPLRR